MRDLCEFLWVYRNYLLANDVPEEVLFLLTARTLRYIHFEVVCRDVLEYLNQMVQVLVDIRAKTRMSSK